MITTSRRDVMMTVNPDLYTWAIDDYMQEGYRLDCMFGDFIHRAIRDDAPDWVTGVRISDWAQHYRTTERVTGKRFPVKILTTVFNPLPWPETGEGWSEKC